jgi:sodium-dependent dicarboxylate transporter 2/3/5
MKRKILLLVLAALLALAVQSIDGINQQAKIVGGVTVFAAVLWFTDAIPLFITSLLIPFLIVFFAGFSPTDAFAPFFDPLIVLLLGGAIIARALIKYELDVEIVHFFLRVTGTKPEMFLLGLMAATAFVSMWISNTATALMMMPIGVAALTLTKLTPRKSSFGKATVLGVAYAATIGGLGTLIGTPPNLITVKFLQTAGISVGFVEWAIKAIPLMLTMLFVAWFVLKKMYKAEIEKIKTRAEKRKKLNSNQKIVLVVFGITVLLWVTEALHGIHNSIVALIPAFIFYSVNMLDTDDFGKIGWDSLILVGGGLCLGMAIHASTLDASIASLLATTVIGQPQFLTLILVSIFTIVFTAFVPNTAGAAIFVPLLIPLAPVLGVSTKAIVLLAGMVISFDFVVPTGTPPNAIAYGTKYVKVSDIIKAGLVISIIGACVASVFAVFW